MRQLSLLVLFIITLLCCVPEDAGAHTGSVKGTVYKGDGGQPLEGASIYIKANNSAAVTDAFGHFFLKGIKEGKYNVSISHIGYETIEQEIKIEDGVTTDLDVKLQQSAVKMSEVAINSKKELNLSTISGLDLKQRPVNNAQDLMRLVPGLFTSQHQGGGKAEQIFLRGFDCDHGTDINVSVDGTPVNMVSHAHGQGFADSHFIIPETVQGMDFGKGPYRIDKGNLTTAGWVEFRTKELLDNSFVKMEGGMYGYFRTAAGIDLLDGKTKNGRQSAYVAGEYGYNRSYFDKSQDFNRFNLMGKYTNYLAENKKLTVTLSGFRSYWNASGQIPERAVRLGVTDRFGELDNEGGMTSRYSVNAQYFQSINNNSYFKSNVYLGYYDFSLFSDFTYFLEDSGNGDQIHQSEKRIFGGYNADYNTNYAIAGLKAKTQIGMGLRHDDITGSELSHTANRDLILKRIEYGDINETNLFGYVNETIELLPQLVLNLGTRFDYFVQDYHDRMPSAEARNHEYTNHALSPKAGVYYNVSDRARLYFNYGTGFHTNDTRTLAVGVPLAGESIVQHVLPQANCMDLGIIIKPYSKLLLSAAVWQLDMQEEFTYGGDEGVVEPSGRTRRKGVDLSLRYELTKWLYADVDANYTHARYRDEVKGQDYIPLAAGFTSIGGLSFKINKDLTAGIRYRFMADRPAAENYSLTAKGYTLCDMVVSYSRPKYEFGMQIQNLFNTEWREAQFATETRLRTEVAQGIPGQTDICYTPGTPFFLKLSATYKF
ncbi:MAG: TonB-dependent receptor [Bacteroidetes bacterium]|nr:TonB-dependent receptor [Bacteroidota bacterium]